ncbi:hypothetical protein ABZV93_21965 [Actinopolymorpha sp. NPDC004070]|uniref:hypothetical protein n=1 Tax=Actinopolymorpha sp. NPDC004070 TaxID=3154548 RepID=UPI0033AFACA5
MGVSALTGLVPRLRTGRIRWRIAPVFGLPGAAAAFGGAAVNRPLPPWVVLAGSPS